MAGKKNFGFEMNTGRQIDMDHADTLLATELDEVVGAWSSCINCGSCAATCPAGINFRKIHYQIRMSVNGHPVETDNYLSHNYLSHNYLSLQCCFLCGKCQLVCPRGIPTRYLAIQITQKTKQYAENISPV